jgi:predicted DNA-binding ribbon-helix-helix protein
LGGIYNMQNESLTIKKRGEDGNRVISVRIKENILEELDKIAAESNYSRNELINIILDYGAHNIEIR